MATVADMPTGYACPHEPLDEALFTEILREYANAFVSLFLDRSARLLEERGQGVVDLLEAGANDSVPTELLLDQTVANLRNSVLGSARVPPSGAAAAFCAQMAFIGRAEDFHLSLDEPQRLRIGPELLPQTTFVRFHASADRSWPNGELIPSFRVGDRDVQVWTGDLLRELPAEPNPEERPSIPLAGVLSMCRSAVEILERCAPFYIPWIARVLRVVVPVDGSDGIMRSSSDDDRPGVVFVSFPHGAVAIAEMLVHEASHQYYHVLTRLGEPVDPKDETGYFSPIKGRDRPLSAVLLAYHSFANVVLFYRLCRAAGVDDDGYVDGNERRHLPELATLLTHLESAASMTPLGDALWKPLARRIS